MTNILVAQMSQFTKLSSEEALAIEESFPIRTYEKGTFLLKEGQIAKNAYLLIEGCIRKYMITDETEITLDFYTEGQSVADFNSLSHQKPSKYYFICSETVNVAVINSEKEAELYKKFPRFEAICRVEFEKMIGANSDNNAQFMGKSPEDKYRYILEQRADLLNRVPQYQLASYLGIKPESLSRIRKRIVQK